VLAFELGLEVENALDLDDAIGSVRNLLDGECSPAEFRAVAKVQPGSLVDAVLRVVEERDQLLAEITGHRDVVERLELEVASLTLDVAEAG